MPSIISVIVVGILWSVIFSPFGPLAETLNNLNKDAYTKTVNEVMERTNNGNIQDKDYLLLISLADSRDVSSWGDTAAEQRVNLKSFVTSFVNAKDKPFTIDRQNELETSLVNLLSPKYRADFLNQPDVAMIPVLFVILWMFFGYYMILFLANMQKIDTHVIEAAAIDGATERQVLWHVILPALSGIIATTAILAISGSLRSFGIVWAMTGGGPARLTQVLAIYSFDNAFRGAPNYPLANSISTMMIVFSLILIFVTRSVEKRFGGKE
jgi:ABC-type sugar transport system permease subunit